MPPKPRLAPRDEILNQKQLAARLDLDPRQIRNLVKKGMPKMYLRETGSEPGYAWPACLHWYVRFKLDAEVAKFTSAGRLQAAQIREAEARASKMELQLEVTRGSMLPIGWIAERERRLLEQLAIELRTFGQRIRHDLVRLPDAPAVDRVLSERIDEAIVSCRTALLGGSDEELDLEAIAEEADDDDDNATA